MKSLIDLSAMNPLGRPVGIDGAFIRCGTGLHDYDSMYTKHVANLVGTTPDARLGAYHVIAPSSGNPEGQAANLVAWSAYSGVCLPRVVDVERNRPLNTDAKAWRDFIVAYVKALPSKLLLYTYSSFLTELLGAGLDLGLFRGLFLAKYPTLVYDTPAAEALRKSVLAYSDQYVQCTRKGDGAGAQRALAQKYSQARALSGQNVDCEPLAMPPKDALLWQWGGDANAATCPGVDGLVDRSYFLGSDVDWDAFVET